MITTVVILVVISSAMAGVVYQLFRQSHINAFSQDLINQTPVFIAQMHQSDLFPGMDNWLNSLAEIEQVNYTSAICEGDNLLWVSQIRTNDDPTPICKNTQSLSDGFGIIEDENNRVFLTYIATAPHSNDNANNQTRFIVIRLATDFVEQRTAVERNSLLAVFGFITLSILALSLAFHWSFKPLEQLADELDDISDGKQKDLKANYPIELTSVTEALNRLIYLSQDQGERYRHAMDDLAHSLKSRIAAIHAFIDDSALTQIELHNKINEQISQMDELIQYQLKRAMLGHQGLVKESTPLADVTASLERMLSKVYHDKQISLFHDYNSDIQLPMNHNDVLELFGNLLENAYRFALSEVRIHAHKGATYITIRIEDDGPGVKEEHRENIFQRGVRADQLNPGQGIGLAVCHEIISIYQGDIWVEEADIEGAAFVITIPITNY
ncbi:ATP-binding protein [Thaumasiovibrio sp. DFM-14]|uniref:ATP-binding protein n=1 Tax=Thaumasiovibrio sp. DFM-14 TaxID=3384792 RepID=UPI0039A220A9